MGSFCKRCLAFFIIAMFAILCVACAGGARAKVQLSEGILEGFSAADENAAVSVNGPLGYLAPLVSQESSNTHAFRLCYPKSTNEHFNRLMRSAASGQIKRFHALRSERSGINRLLMNYQIKDLDDHILSILFLVRTSEDGDEEGKDISLFTKNFSVQTGYPLNLSDLFHKDSGYEDTLLRMVTDELIQAYSGGGKLHSFSGGRDEEKLRQDIALKIEDLAEFYLEKSDISFVIRPGKVAPQDIGPVVVSVAKEQLGEYLLDAGAVVGVKPTPFPTPKTDIKPAKGKKYVALTFDDGPHGTYTPQLLDVLKQKNAKATFFCLGTNAAKYPEIVKRAKEEGHLVCSHTWSHKNLNSLSANKVEYEIAHADEVIGKIIGEKPKYIRPPYGNANNTVCKAAARVLVNWSVDPEDWKVRDAKKITERIVRSTKEGYIILCHDIYSETVQSVSDTIDQLREKGYEFVTVDQLFSIYNTELKPGTVLRMAK